MQILNLFKLLKLNSIGDLMTGIIQNTFSNSWKVYKKSFSKILVIVSLFILSMVVVGGISVAAFGVGTVEQYLSYAENATSYKSLASSGIFSALMSFFMVFIIVESFVAIYFNSVINALASKPKMKTSKIFRRGNEKYLTLILADILVGLIFLATVLVSGILIALSVFVPLLVPFTVLLAIIAIIYIKLRLYFIFPEIYIKNRNAVESIKYSWKKSRKNVLNIFAVFSIIVLISIPILILPAWISSIINLYLIWPFTILCIFELYKQARK